ncbi:molybdopterin molybdenumtransferase [bacterium MnTg03]|nr:molybdopterin molybdenumtransferase [bacterium MnTg03]
MNQCDPPKDRLIPYDEALQQLIAKISPLQRVVRKPLLEAFGEVLAESQRSTIDVPQADNSSMDGYALNTSDLASSGATELPVSQRIAAGEAGEPLQPGTAARIFTGAPIPAGADLVIMQEQVRFKGDTIRFDINPESGSNIRRAGNDIRSGDTILQKGCRLRPQDIGLAASVGLESLPVFEKIRVGIFLAGDELVEPGKPLAVGQIYDSNRYTLQGMLQALGCEIIDLGLVGDTLEETKTAMLNAAQQADLVVSSGGVSVGEEDHVRIAIEQLGDLHLWRLRIKPGKPLAFGAINSTPFIGLPGNPVSVFVTFCLFVCPLIKTLQGRTWQKPVAVQVVASFDWPKPDSRREFLRARLESGDDQAPVAKIYPNQDSGVLSSAVWAQGFVEIAEGQTLRAGDKVDYFCFEQFLS